MKINRNNYETYFIDYLEGNLDEKMVDDFIEFLQQNPDLKEELSLFESVSVEQEEITFNKKELLLKEKFDVEHEFNNAAIAILEGDISEDEKQEFERYLLTHPAKQKEISLFALTKLQPDKNVVFKTKNTLYRYLTPKTVLLWPVRIAAVVVVALSVYLFVHDLKNDKVLSNQLVEVETQNKKIESVPPVNKLSAKDSGQEEQKETIENSVNPANKKYRQKSVQTTVVREIMQESPFNHDRAPIGNDEEKLIPIKSLTASLKTDLPETGLAPVNIKNSGYYLPVYEERLLVDVIKEKTGIEKLNFNKITKAGLTLAASLSNEKFSFETNNEGKITEVSFDSRLLAFSINTKPEKSGK